eukprot:1196401-Prorocentrum_minimum.AAC.3
MPWYVKRTSPVMCRWADSEQLRAHPHHSFALEGQLVEQLHARSEDLSLFILRVVANPRRWSGTTLVLLSATKQGFCF